MKKTLKLKLIEVPTSYTPQLNDLIYHSEKGYSIYNGNFAFGKIHKPIAISDEEIKVGDSILYKDKWIYKVREVDPVGYICTDSIKPLFHEVKKIELLPEHFSNDVLQLIVDGKLKDNDEIEVEYDVNYEEIPRLNSFQDISFKKTIGEIKLDSNGKAIISVPESKDKTQEPIMYSEEEVLRIIDDVEEELMKEVGNDYEYNGVSHYVEMLRNAITKSK